ncbi:MAG: penicillin-binding transpeptidase domain-containing protein [Bryobacteraceae bacterium]
MWGWRRGEESERARGTGRATGRMVGLALVALIWALAILCRLVYLQIVCHKAYQEIADRQQHRIFKIEAARGAILDRCGRPLALSLPVDSVCINPLRVPDASLAAEILAGVLRVDRQEFLARLDRAKADDAGFLWVKRKITPEEAERLHSLKLEFVEFRAESQRHYPDGSLASHVVGTVDFQERGNLGLEQSLDKELVGRPGSVKMLTDVQQRGVEALATSAAEPGANITLSIDERIQFLVEREIKAACELRNAASGSAVVMNPYTGEILALASYPSFDPNRPPQSAEERAARFNHPVSVPFEPGSVFKIITLSAALETTSLRPDSPINCGGGTLNLFGRVIHEAKHGYGTLSFADVLAKSSNIGAIQIGLKVGEKNLLEYVRRFGFGKRTGIPLPAESSGTVRDLKFWGKSSIGSVAMGHEISTTALQLAQACSVIANGGMLVRPRLILKRQRPGGKPQNEPAEPPRRILKPETAITMRQLMEGVVLHGTGKGARLPGYTSGGKTGSAQIFDQATKHYTHFYNGSFVGFAPVTNPAVVIAVTLNGTKQFGAVVAGPVFKSVAVDVLRLLDVPRDLPETAPEPAIEPAETNDVAIAELSTPPEDLSTPPADPSAVPAVTSAEATAPPAAMVVVAAGPRVPSFQGKTVRAVLEESLAAGVPVDVLGSGVARGQAPAAGEFLHPGERVRVQFQ